MSSYSLEHQDASDVLLDVLFEVSSAFGTVGLSLGYRGSAASFSYILPTYGQLTICLTMLLGRHRGFPTNLFPLDYYSFTSV